MATSQKKTTKKAPAKRTAQRGGSGGRRKAPPKKQPVRREVGGALCLLAALFVLVGYFQRGAWLIDKLRELCCGLAGFGWYLAVPALLLAAWILIMHRGRRVGWPLVCALLLPGLLGAIAYLAVTETMPGSEGLLKALWADGIAGAMGGAFSGALAVGFHAVLGKVAAMIVFVVAFVGCLMVALRLTPAAIIDAVKSHEFVPYDEPEDEPERQPNVPARPARFTRPRPSIDIPLDDAPAQPQSVSTELPKPPKTSFFAKKPDRIRTPDELLTQEIEAQSAPPAAKKPEPKIVITAAPPASEEPLQPTVVAAPPAPAEPKPVPVEPKPAPVEPKHTAPQSVVTQPAPAPKLDPITPPPPAEPKSDKLDRGAVQQAAAEVTAEIEASGAGAAEYRYPSLTLLTEGAPGNAEAAGAELRNNSRRLAETLKSFGVEASAGDVVRGPSVTRYEFMLEQGVKLSKITNLQDDIALALGATGVRIAPIPDKISVVGIEVPNKHVTPVHIRDVLGSTTFTSHKSGVCFAVGKDINGNPIVGDIAKFPHVLIAGTTGSGKSVCTNSLIVSMLYKSTPEDVRFIMVDPKMVELAPYNGIPHLLIPVVTDPKKAAGALQWAVYEMMKRYQIFSNHGVKELSAYNELAARDPELVKYPKVVVVIDELADLMLVAAKEVEESICRVAQMGRAAGMHLVIATQRPSADVITGLMKANIPSRIAFAVASSLESRIILDNTGAEKLVGKGDMLYAPLGEGKPRRVQGCFISAEEIDRVVGFIKENSEASYDKNVIDQIEQNVAEKERGSGKNAAPADDVPADDADEMLCAAIEVVLETGQASTSMLQRRLKLGYSRAARIVDQMEERGIVGPFEGSKPRQLLITREQWEELKMKGQSMPEAAPAAAPVAPVAPVAPAEPPEDGE
ncbi:MAG: DNA translocase FtsK [Ruminococcaceae bacterium]|nr:DNA translocase FtsK [Oscillospiraceae bacterium]